MEQQSLVWRRSTRTGPNGGACVEVATDGTEHYLRDSKRPDDGYLTVDREAFVAFLGWLRAQ